MKRFPCGILGQLMLFLATAHDCPGTSNLVPRYGRMRLAFEPNLGQAHQDVRFLARAGNSQIFLTPNETVLALATPLRPAIIRIAPVGGSAGSFKGTERLEGVSHYIFGPSPDASRTHIPHYGKVTQAEVFPGVDIVYYGNEGNLEYDIVLRPGADPSKVQLSISGIDSLQIDDYGNLTMEVQGGLLKQSKPTVYQEIDGKRRIVAAKYIKVAQNVISFEVTKFDSTKSLVIDPVLAYAGYAGGSGMDQANAVAVDSSGSAYITGVTRSVDFPRAGGFPAPPAQYIDALFVTKLNPAGNAIVYSTIIAPPGGTWGRSIAVDAAGNAYVGGYTGAPSFPVTPGAFQPAMGSRFDAFVLKLNAAGSALVISTFLGGTGEDRASAIALDPAGNIYVSGTTDSENFPVSPGSYRTTFAGSSDGFVTKFSASGSLVYSTYLGGSRFDEATAVTTDNGGSVYVTGKTSSTDFPTTAGSHQQTFPGANENAFITRMNSNGTGLIFSTYLGGSGETSGSGIGLDPAGNVIVAGRGAAIPATSGAFQTTYVGAGSAVWVAKYRTDNGSLLYLSRFGGNLADGAAAMAVDQAGDITVVGTTESADYPVTPGALQLICPGQSCGFISRLNNAGTALVYSSFFGDQNSVPLSVAVDAMRNTYFTGYAQTTSFPYTLGAVRNGTGQVPFVAKITDPTTCSFSIAPTSRAFDVGAGTVNVNVTAPPGCNWVSANPVPWASISGTPGSGTGIATVRVTSNPGPARETVLSIAGNRFTVSQPDNCSYEIYPPSSSFPALGGRGGFSVLTGSGCPWVPTSDVDWIQFNGGDVSTGVVYYTVQPLMTGLGRTGTITVAGAKHVVAQQSTSCSYGLNPPLASHGSGPISASVGVSTQPGCVWSARSESFWLFINPLSGTGGGSVSYTGFRNIFPTGRTGTLRIADKAFPVSQAPGGPSTPPEPINLSPFSGSGVSQTFTIEYSDADGQSDLLILGLKINEDYVASNSACELAYLRPTNQFQLLADDGQTWSIPIVAGSTGTLQNSQCALNTAASTVSTGSDRVTLSVALTFSPAFSQARPVKKLVCPWATDSGGATSGYSCLGVWFPSTIVGKPVNRYRLYSPVTLSHLFTTDRNEFDVLGTVGWVQEGIGMQLYDAPAQVQGVNAIPYYRMYYVPGRRHFWTSDRNEYVTLIKFRNLFVGEGVDGYVLSQAVAGTVPLYRVLFPRAIIHHWTVDEYEYRTLVSGGWIDEGIVGHVFPPPAGGVSGATATDKPDQISVLSSASFQRGNVTAGQMVTVFGPDGQKPERVWIDGVRTPTLVSEVKSETRIIVPDAFARKSAVRVDVEVGGRNVSTTVALAPASPAIFTIEPFGRGQAQALNEDRTANSPDNPAWPGSLVDIWATGLRPDNPATAYLAGIPTEVVTMAPDGVGKMRLVIRVPKHPMTKSALLIIKAGEASSQQGVLLSIADHRSFSNSGLRSNGH